jgi:hypothetical protein
MLKVGETSDGERLDPLTKFKLFECEDVTGPLGLIPQGLQLPARRTQQANDDALGNDDNGTAYNADQFPPLPANDALAQAVSQVQLSLDEWAPLHIFKLFAVLVNPPPGLDFSAMEGLRDYLAQLVVMIGGLVENGVRDIATHCWWILLGNCSTSNIPRV